MGMDKPRCPLANTDKDYIAGIVVDVDDCANCFGYVYNQNNSSTPVVHQMDKTAVQARRNCSA